MLSDNQIVLLTTAGAAILVSIWWFLYKWRIQHIYNPPLPPGSFGLPFVGETLEWLRKFKSNSLAEFYESRVEKYGPVFKTSLFGKPVVFISPPAGLKLMFSSHSKLLETAYPSSIKSLIGDKSLGFMNGIKAKNFRHIMMAFLGPEGLQRYVARASSILEKLIQENMLLGTEVEARKIIKRGLFSVVFELFLSLSDEQEPELLGWSQDMVNAMLEVPISIPGTTFYRGKMAQKKLYTRLHKIIAQRRHELEIGSASSSQDLLSVLLTTKDEEGHLMTDEEIIQNIATLILAGHDTSASSLVVSVKYLAANPKCLEEVRKENLAIASAKVPGEPLSIHDVKKMKYTWRAIQESMRMIPTTIGNMRRIISDIEVEGFTVPAGWQLIWSIHASNKNEEFFTEPEKFDPDRFNNPNLLPYSYTPFGGGPRICPGYELAKMLVLAPLEH